MTQTEKSRWCIEIIMVGWWWAGTLSSIDTEYMVQVIYYSSPVGTNYKAPRQFSGLLVAQWGPDGALESAITLLNDLWWIQPRDDFGTTFYLQALSYSSDCEVLHLKHNPAIFINFKARPISYFCLQVEDEDKPKFILKSSKRTF